MIFQQPCTSIYQCWVENDRACIFNRWMKISLGGADSSIVCTSPVDVKHRLTLKIEYTTPNGSIWSDRAARGLRLRAAVSCGHVSSYTQIKLGLQMRHNKSVNATCPGFVDHCRFFFNVAPRALAEFRFSESNYRSTIITYFRFIVRRSN